MAATGAKEDFLAYSRYLGASELGRLIASQDLKMGGSVNVSYSPPGETGRVEMISPQMYRNTFANIDAKEVRSILLAVQNAGYQTSDRFVRCVGTHTSPPAVSRLSVAESRDAVFIGIRVFVPASYSLEELIGRNTIPRKTAELIVQLLLYAPSVVLAICGAGGSGKSTLLNAIVQELQNRKQSLPSMVLYPGDAQDIVTASVPVLPAIWGDDAIAMLKSANARFVLIGETITERTLEVFLNSRGAFQTLLTTLHGETDVAAKFMPATMYIEMRAYGRQIVTQYVSINIRKIAPDFQGAKCKREIEIQTRDGRGVFVVPTVYVPSAGVFDEDEEWITAMLGYLRTLVEKYHKWTQS